MNVELWAITPNAEVLIERAARICYRSEGDAEKRAVFIRRLIELGHESVIEHASATFLFEGASRAMSHQLVRHRLAAFSQESMRYVDPEKIGDVQWVVPPAIANDPGLLEDFEIAMRDAMRAYRVLKQAGAKKEDARFVLPIATPTRIVMTANFREWRHVIKMRALNKHAQWEIREAILKVLELLHGQAPAVFGDLMELR